MNFIAIDFETANRYPNSVCAIGIVVVEKNIIINRDYHLIRPPKMYFEPINIKVHGIQPDDVEDAPTFDELWPQLKSNFNQSLILAHYARFDIGVLKAILHTYNIEGPDFHYSCTYHLAKRAYPRLHNHKLNTVSNALNIKLNHHHALSDANACANIGIATMERLNINSLDQLMKTLPVGKFQL